MIYYMTVNTCIHCQTCVNRMFNINSIIEVGMGNITSDIVIVLPKVYSKQHGNTLFKDLKAIWLECTSSNILEKCYITTDIKCPKLNPYGRDITVCQNCNKILNEELSHVPYRYMIVFGKAIDVVFPGIKHNKYVTDGYRHILWFSPYNKTDGYDKQALKDFMSKVINWIHYEK